MVGGGLTNSIGYTYNGSLVLNSLFFWLKNFSIFGLNNSFGTKIRKFKGDTWHKIMFQLKSNQVGFSLNFGYIYIYIYIDVER